MQAAAVKGGKGPVDFMQRCGKCGSESRDEVSFCTSCGGQLVLELGEIYAAEAALELQGPPALASACWRGERSAVALETLRAILPLGTVEPFGRNADRSDRRSRLGSDAADLMSGLLIEVGAPDRVVDMLVPGGAVAGGDVPALLWNRLRMADARASGTVPASAPEDIPSGPVQASYAAIAGWRVQSGTVLSQAGR